MRRREGNEREQLPLKWCLIVRVLVMDKSHFNNGNMGHVFRRLAWNLWHHIEWRTHISQIFFSSKQCSSQSTWCQRQGHVSRRERHRLWKTAIVKCWKHGDQIDSVTEANRRRIIIHYDFIRRDRDGGLLQEQYLDELHVLLIFSFWSVCGWLDMFSSLVFLKFFYRSQARSL